MASRIRGYSLMHSLIAPLLLASAVSGLAFVGASAPVLDPTPYLFGPPGSATPIKVVDVTLSGATGQAPGDYLTVSANWTGTFAVRGGIECDNVTENWSTIALDFLVVLERETINFLGLPQPEEVASLTLHHVCAKKGMIWTYATSPNEKIAKAYERTILGRPTLEQLLAFLKVHDAPIKQLSEEDAGKRFRVKVQVRSAVHIEGFWTDTCKACTSGTSPLFCNEWSDWGYSDWTTVSFRPRTATPFTLKFFFSPIRYRGDPRSDWETIKMIAGTWKDLTGLSEDAVLKKVYVDLLGYYFEMRELSGDGSLGKKLSCHATDQYRGMTYHDARANIDYKLTYVITCEDVKLDTDYAWVFYYYNNGVLYRDILRVHINSSGELERGTWIAKHQIAPSIGDMATSGGIERAGFWVIKTVDAPKRFFNMSRRVLALDASGDINIVYGRDHLYYAWRNDTGWHIEIVDGGGGVIRFPSLAMNSSGHPHISYFDDTNENLKYAWYDGASWHIEVVDSAGDVGKYTSLALDSSGRPHISYFDDTNENLKYAWYDGASWHIETVDSKGDLGWFSSLAVDSSGHPHISYYDGTNGDLKYAFLTSH